MLSILPVRQGVVVPDAGPSPVDRAMQPTVNVFQIVILDRDGTEARPLVPVRELQRLSAPRRSRRRIAALTATAAALCATAGFAAGVLFGKVPAPGLPSPPPALSRAHAWLDSHAPVTVQPLPSRAAASGAAIPGWVAATDLGGAALQVHLLEGTGAQATLAIELQSEPRMAMLRGVSSRAFDIDLGPVSGMVREQDLVAAAAGSGVSRVSVRKVAGNGEGLVRIRVNLDVPGQGNVRVVGRTIYADFAARSAAS